MGYIKCRVYSRLTDENGMPTSVRIGRLESDMVDTNIYELPILMHALSAISKVRMLMKVDVGVLDRDELGSREYMRLDSGKLEIDYIL